MRINRKNIHFTLVEPQSPGNVGAAARALKTMGFENLILVNPCNIKDPEAQWLAHASQDILNKAKIFDNLSEAIAKKNFVVATTQRERSFHLPFYTPKELAEKIVSLSQEHSIVIVFGREKSGLTNEEIRECDAISTVPAFTKHPALNLAQTVMIYCYELFQSAYGDLKKYKWRVATHGDLDLLYTRLRKSLEKINFVPIDSWDNFILRFSRMIGRANPEIRDIRVWHKIFKSFDDYIEQLEKNRKNIGK
jgi:TrmH family RNA methyltransferase